MRNKQQIYICERCGRKANELVSYQYGSHCIFCTSEIAGDLIEQNAKLVEDFKTLKTLNDELIKISSKPVYIDRDNSPEKVIEVTIVYIKHLNKIGKQCKKGRRMACQECKPLFDEVEI